MTDLLPMATPVRFHHRAAVARHVPMVPGQWDNRGWKLFEGCHRGEPIPDSGDPFSDLVTMFFDHPMRTIYGSNVNKTVMVWPHEGEGWIFGLVRRSIGHSYSASGGGGGVFDDSWEPGGHTSEMWIRLYAVKQHMQGTDYILCPLWAVRERDE